MTIPAQPYPLTGRSFKSLEKEYPLNDPLQKAIIDQILQSHCDTPGGLMVILNEIQSRIGFVSQPIQEYVARVLNTPVSAIHGVITFYSFFTTEPRGERILKFCMGTACYVGGTPQLVDKATQLLGVSPGQTTPDGKITVEVCRCVGACSQAPVVVVDEQMYGRIRPSKMPALIRDVLKSCEDASGG
ncbi:MAG: NAD(P)H-dependent oxidoreductase subunit E [Anaerolineaceae bacterium]|nr:NAD(P)H-dependent oxidoreductase subunit E [Anaerolineaceae bacterium]